MWETSVSTATALRLVGSLRVSTPKRRLQEKGEAGEREPEAPEARPERASGDERKHATNTLLYTDRKDNKQHPRLTAAASPTGHDSVS